MSAPLRNIRPDLPGEKMRNNITAALCEKSSFSLIRAFRTTRQADFQRPLFEIRQAAINRLSVITK